MQIGPRITLTSAVLVTITLGIYSYVTLRSQAERREQRVIDEAQNVAAELKKRAAEGASPAELNRLAKLAGPYWQAALISADEDVADAGLELLRSKMINNKAPVLETRPERLTYLEPLRVDPEQEIVGALVLTRRTKDLAEEYRRDRTRTLVSMALLIAVLVLAVSFSARRHISKPLEKLLVGIDDVAKGDLSHVVLAEREDEIGALATRFNEMTGSLREARAETRRGVEARLQLEAHLRQTEKLATLGQIAAEIAHEVGTPLNVVTGRARTMARKAEDPEQVQKNATIIAEQAERITRIIQRLLDFARRKVGDAERAQVDLNKLATDSLELLEHQLANSRVETRVRMDRELATLAADKDQVQQVLLNLFLNAIQAMPQGGTLTVATSRVVRRRPGLELAPEQTYAVLEVLDTGPGIPPESREKIFEPFYTSKAGAGGTGLGLAVAHGIVKDHDGWIEIDDNHAAGHGTVFRVFFPMTSTHG